MKRVAHSRLDPAALLERAVAAARAAGEHARRHADRRHEVVRGFAHDVKLRLDAECQAVAESVVRAAYPEHAILGEETAAGAGRPAAGDGYEWIIDPIDGTVNFYHGLPLWCCSVAVRLGGQTLAGAVYAPVLGRLYTATVATAARCNGRRLHVSDVRRLDRALITTGLDKQIDPALPPFELFRALSSRVQKARVLGSAALDLCLVAAGQADGYFESGIFTWDIAAAELIVRQAGGRAEQLASQGGHRLCFLASNGHIHRALRRLIRPRLQMCPQGGEQ